MSGTPEKMRPSLTDIQSGKIQAKCLPELADRLEVARRALIRAPHNLKHMDQVMGTGPLVAAIVAHFLDQDVEARARIARDGIRIYEAMEDEAASRPAGGPAPEPTAHGASGYSPTNPPLRPPAQREKKAT